MAQVRVKQNNYLVFTGDLEDNLRIHVEENSLTTGVEEVYELADILELKEDEVLT